MTIFVSILISLGIVLAFLVYRFRARPDVGSTRQTRSGRVSGVRTHRGNFAWFGIPYAQPPLGELRWKAPRPAQAWQGVFKAEKFGPRPAQIGGVAGGFSKKWWGKPAGSEDSLRLNVWAPSEKKKSEKGLPVMVWLYGGGNASGGADIPVYQLDHFITGQDIVGVNLNYRLGVFGWLKHPALDEVADTPEDASGNFGTLDVMLALRWVQDNIAEFGGDPDNVTVFGESAGGWNVLSLMVSPLAKGLFHKAIVQSGVTHCASVASAQNYSDDAEAPGHRFSSRELINHLLIRKGSAASRDQAVELQQDMSHADIRSLLYGASMADLLSPFSETIMGMYFHPRPIADGHVLPIESWHELLSDPARCNDVPLMIGSNRDEFKAFMMADKKRYVVTERRFIPKAIDDKTYQRDARYQSALWKASAVDEVANRLSADQRVPVFVYRFDWDHWAKPFGIDLPKLLGAGHGLEVPTQFGLYDSMPLAGRFMGGSRGKDLAELGRAMRSYWVAFAHHANPGTGYQTQLPEWPQWTSTEGDAAPRLLILDTPIRVETGCLSIEALKTQLADDPELRDQEVDRQILYGRLFVHGIMGNYWDTQHHERFTDYEKGGAKRSEMEARAPESIL